LSRIAAVFGTLLTMMLVYSGPPMIHAQELFTLPNGMQVVVDEDERFPLVSLRLYVRAGSGYELKSQEGISHFLEHMAFKGSKKRLPGAVAREIEEAGGRLNAGTSFDYTVYTLDLPAEKVDLGLDVLRDMVFEASLDDHEFNMEKQVVLAEIQRSMDNPGSMLFNSLQSQVWADTPYAHPILGYVETVKAMTPEDMRDYMHRLYQPGSMVLSVSGDVRADRVMDKTLKLFGDVPNSAVISAPGPLNISRASSEELKVRHGPWHKAYLALALPIPELGSPRSTAFDVLAHLLGGDNTSLLYRKFKYEAGLVDDVSVRALTLERAGMLYFYVQMDPDNVDTFWKQFIQVLENLDASLFTPEQLNRARISLEEGLYRSRETLGGKASGLGLDVLLKKDHLARDRFLFELSRVTTHDLQEIIDRYVCVNKTSATFLLPEQAQMVQQAEHIKRDADPLFPEDVQDKERKKQEPLIRDLGQGRKLVVLPDEHLPYTALRIVWPGADRLISPEQQGLTQLAASVLIRETDSRTYTELQEFLKDRGASLGASAGRNSLSLSARFPVRYSEDMYALTAEVITRQEFSAEELRRASANQVASIRSQEDQPMGYAFRHLFPFLFSSGPYSYLFLGEEAYLRQVGPEEAARFWNMQKTMPFVLAVSGQVDMEHLDGLVQSMKKMEVGEPAPPPMVHWGDEKHRQDFMPDRKQAHLLKVFPVPGKKHEHTPGLKVLNKILAGQGGLLFKELRDRQGLAYSVTSMLWQTPETGFLALYIGTFADKTGEALAGFEQILKDLKDFVPEESEVNRATNLLFGEYHRGRQTLSSRTEEASSLLVQGLDLNFRQELIERAASVTPEQVRDLAGKYLDPEQSYLFEVLPK